MKKLCLLIMCYSIVFAKETTDEEIVIPASKPLEESSKSSLLPGSTVLPNAPSRASFMPTKDVTLSTEAPETKAPTVLNSEPLEIPIPTVVQQIKFDSKEDIAALAKEEIEVAEEVKSAGITIDLGQVFAGSPMIYTVLFILSVASVGIWSYALLSLRNSELFPLQNFQTLKNQLHSRHYEQALETCKKHPTLLFGMVATALQNRHQGSAIMLEMMKAEGKRMSTLYWQKIGILNEIAIIAPMLGLLGTVLGMFYAFYDLNRSAESISALFDGLGISVGTTVGGLVVAILALIFHAMTKYRLMRQLSLVESEAQTIVQSIHTKKDQHEPDPR